MKTNIYNALKGRVAPVTIDGKNVYRFSNDGLNKEVNYDDVLYIDSFVFGDAKRLNIWNACQMAYKVLGYMVGNARDERLLNS